jgi:hypothetical protein
MGFVECEDESSEQHTAKFEIFRQIDSMAVPVSIEWVTVLHKEVVARMGVSVAEAATNAGVLAGCHSDYWWIILSEEAFSFTKTACTEKYRAVNEALNLVKIHKRFRKKSS